MTLTSPSSQAAHSRLNDLFVAALPATTAFLFGGLQLFFQNAHEFPLAFVPVTVTLALMSLAPTAVFFALLQGARFINGLLHRVLTVVITAAGVLLWIQGNFLVRQYGIFNGQEIDWSRFARYANIDLALWGGGIVLMLALLRWTYRYAARLAQIVLVIQLISTVFMAFGYEAPEFNRYEEDASRKFVFSKSGNVLFLVLDTFATDIFNAAILPFPEYTNFLDGFTYFRDTMSEFPTTYPAVPAILTGYKFTNQKPFHEFLKESFVSAQSLPFVLKQAGYDVYLPPALYTYAAPETSSNIRKAEPPLVYGPAEMRTLLLATAFRYAPHQLKKPVFSRFLDSYGADPHAEVTGDKKVPADLAFLREFERTIRTEEAGHTMKYYHLLGMHSPYQINENMEAEDIEPTRKGMTRAARGNLKLVERFLQVLRDQGVYDSSLILILGDHGTMVPEQPFGYSFGDMSSLNPLLLIKRPGEHGPLRIADNPATHADIPATVLDALAMNTAGMSGVSLFQNTTEHNTVRHYYSYDWWAEGGWDKDYLPDMTEYIINGSSLDENNWTRTGNVYIPGATVYREDPLAGAPLYSIGDAITFGRLSSRRSYLLEGWGKLGVDELIPIAKTARLMLIIDDIPSEYTVFDLVLSPVDASRPQRVNVSINGKRIDSWVVNSGFQNIKGLVHKSFIKKGQQNILTFEFPDAVAARNQSELELSVVFHGLKFVRGDVAQ